MHNPAQYKRRKSAQIVPPCFSMIRCTVARPTPVPSNSESVWKRCHAVRDGAEEHTERPLRHSVPGKADDGRSCPFGLAEAEENPHPQPEVVLDVCS
jgi:hypothetical protein